MNPEDIEFTRRDYEDLKGNPIWERFVAEAKDRYQGLIEELLKLDHPAAIEANLLLKIIERPKEIVEELEE